VIAEPDMFDKLRECMESEFPAAHFSDADYVPIVEAWLLGQYAKWYRQLLILWKVVTWRAHFDCDNYASLYFALAQLCYGRMKGVEGHALAIGEVWYMQDSGGAHAINCAFVDDNRLIFIEPQTQKKIELSDKERRSIYFTRF
jgi:hypothetical protein